MKKVLFITAHLCVALLASVAAVSSKGLFLGVVVAAILMNWLFGRMRFAPARFSCLVGAIYGVMFLIAALFLALQHNPDRQLRLAFSVVGVIGISISAVRLLKRRTTSGADAPVEL